MPKDENWAELFACQVDHAEATPLFRQVYRQFRAAILARSLRPGAKLPSTRALASRLGIARASVVAAYELLLAEGYVSGKIGSGTYISSDLPEPPVARRRSKPEKASPGTAPRLPPPPDFAASTAQSDERPFNLGRTLVDARTVETWRKLTQRALRSLGPRHLGYADPCGFIELRRTICDYLRAARAVRARSDHRDLRDPACGPSRLSRAAAPR